jgi:hypothetical protein
VEVDVQQIEMHAAVLGTAIANVEESGVVEVDVQLNHRQVACGDNTIPNMRVLKM